MDIKQVHELVKMDLLNKTTAAFFLEAFKEKTKEIGAEMGVELEFANQRSKAWGPCITGAFSISFVHRTKDGFPVPVSEEAIRFLLNCRAFGMNFSDLGQKIVFKGKELRILGFIWRGKHTKFILASEQKTGKKYRVPIKVAIGLLPI